MFNLLLRGSQLAHGPQVADPWSTSLANSTHFTMCIHFVSPAFLQSVANLPYGGCWPPLWVLSFKTCQMGDFYVISICENPWIFDGVGMISKDPWIMTVVQNLPTLLVSSLSPLPCLSLYMQSCMRMPHTH